MTVKKKVTNLSLADMAALVPIMRKMIETEHEEAQKALDKSDFDLANKHTDRARNLILKQAQIENKIELIVDGLTT